ncbi:MAG TPA: hypothetical protein PKL59_23015, partial [Nitrospira sp.]|nr:hypothetical protein [Nitrospira sp.]
VGPCDPKPDSPVELAQDTTSNTRRLRCRGASPSTPASTPTRPTQDPGVFWATPALAAGAAQGLAPQAFRRPK